MSEVSTLSGGPEAAPSTGQKVDVERPKDHFGNEREVDLERFPEGSPAREGQATRPSGQGGASPHDGIAYQDMWPENPPPSDSAREKGEENDRIARGEITDVELANERLANITGTAAEPNDAQREYADEVRVGYADEDATA